MHTKEREAVIDAFRNDLANRNNPLQLTSFQINLCLIRVKRVKDLPRCTPQEAARLLGVTRSRVEWVENKIVEQLNIVQQRRNDFLYAVLDEERGL